MSTDASDEADVSSSEANTAEHRVRSAEPVTGRLGMLTGMSLLVGAIPIPFLPHRALGHLRGAIVHEVAARHGLSFSSGAREILANPTTKDRMREALRRGLEMITKRILRRLGPLGPLSALARTVEVYALGVMFERYLERFRSDRSARILEAEARRVREAIDTAVLQALYPSVQASPLLLPEGAEDLRDEFTRWIDTALVTTATFPSYLERRLLAAFDEAITASADRDQG